MLVWLYTLYGLQLVLYKYGLSVQDFALGRTLFNICQENIDNMSKTSIGKGKRSRKKDTRRRIMEAACEAFAEHGFRGTTVRMICAKAKANVAAVSYYFGSKEKLYVKTYEHLFDDSLVQTLAEQPLHVTNASEWKEELRHWALTVLRMIMGERPTERWRCRIYARERVDPSAVLPQIYEKFFTPIEQRLDALLAMATPPDMDKADRHILRISTISQCIIYTQRTPPWDKALIPSGISKEDWMNRVADQVLQSVTCRLSYRGS